MKILIVSSFPVSKASRYGGGHRVYGLARALGGKHELHLVQMDGCDDRYDEKDEDFCPRSSLTLKVSRGSKLGQKVGVFRLPFGNCYDLRRPADRKNIERFKEFVQGRGFDFVFFLYPPSLRFLEPAFFSEGTAYFYAEDDLYWEYLREKRNLCNGRLRKMVRSIRFRMAIAYYRERAKTLSGILCISRHEAEMASTLLPKVKVHNVSYGIVLEEHPMLPTPTSRPCIGFIGNFSHEPNVLAARFLIQVILPELRRSIPDARLCIAGANARSLEIAPMEGLEVISDIDEVHDFYLRVHVVVCPVSTQHGARTKVLEAAAFGRPIVATSRGAEGFENLDIHISEDAAGLSSLICDLFTQPEVYEATRTRNRLEVERNYSLTCTTAYLETLLLSGRPADA